MMEPCSVMRWRAPSRLINDMMLSQEAGSKGVYAATGRTWSWRPVKTVRRVRGRERSTSHFSTAYSWNPRSRIRGWTGRRERASVLRAAWRGRRRTWAMTRTGERVTVTIGDLRRSLIIIGPVHAPVHARRLSPRAPLLPHLPSSARCAVHSHLRSFPLLFPRPPLPMFSHSTLQRKARRSSQQYHRPSRRSSG